MKRLWQWLVARRRTLGKVGLAWLALELLAGLAAAAGLRAWL